MTMTLDQPQTQNENGNGGPLATMKWRGAELVITHDNGPFAHLLDTGKFTQMYRLAEMFSGSELVPQIFRGKPNDCFIAIQMAMRLGVDPFMFLQNTYPGPGGKPGMEGKLAIALVNSSGLFKGQIRYELAGAGDERGCIAWAIDKETGERLNGPRVTIGIAKAEGWYARNKKWQTVPDLMLQYRAGAWFGRLMCPERLMGMQTQEALEELPRTTLIEPEQPRGTAGLLTKLQSRNGGGDQVRDPYGQPVPLPDTQLSDEEAERVIQEKARQTREAQSPPAPAEDVSPSSDDPAPPDGEDQPGAGGDEQHAEEEQPQVEVLPIKGPRGSVIGFPASLPAAWRKDVKALDDLIQHVKPTDVAMPTARNAFKKRFNPNSWHALSADEQDTHYAAILAGKVNWSA